MSCFWSALQSKADSLSDTRVTRRGKCFPRPLDSLSHTRWWASARERRRYPVWKAGLGHGQGMDTCELFMFYVVLCSNHGNSGCRGSSYTLAAFRERNTANKTHLCLPAPVYCREVQRARSQKGEACPGPASFTPGTCWESLSPETGVWLILSLGHGIWPGAGRE